MQISVQKTDFIFWCTEQFRIVENTRRLRTLTAYVCVACVFVYVWENAFIACSLQHLVISSHFVL